jgi:hypothetical protein
MSNNINIFYFTKPSHNSDLSSISPCIMNKCNVNSEGSKQRNRKMLTPVFGNLTERDIVFIKYNSN